MFNWSAQLSCNAACTNSAGTFSCACNSGYTGDGTACSDIDECSIGVHNCHANAACTNSAGTFSCACNSGYTGDGTACSDIDECSTGVHNCDANAACRNSAGTFSCACNSGYTGDIDMSVQCAQLSCMQHVRIVLAHSRVHATVDTQETELHAQT